MENKIFYRQRKLERPAHELSRVARYTKDIKTPTLWPQTIALTAFTLFFYLMVT